MKYDMLQIEGFLACDLHPYSIGMKSIASKKTIFFICLTLVLILFFYPFSPLVEDYISAAPLIGQEKEVILSEPSIMLFIGLGLLAMGIFVKRKFKKSL
jgi:hypothetical protein